MPIVIGIGFIEDDDFIRNSLEDFFKSKPDFEIVFSCNSIEQFLNTVGEFEHPEIVITDIGLPGIDGIQGISSIRKYYKEVPILVLSVYSDNEKIFKALCAGATGYLQKDTPLTQIYSSILTILNGGSVMSPAIARKVIDYFAPKRKLEEALTPKEQQVVQALVDGLSYKLIADRLCVGIETIRHHIKNIYKKLQVNSKAEVIAKSLKGEI